MNKIKDFPSLKGVFRLGFLDFYVFLALAVCMITGVPSHILTEIIIGVVVVFCLSILLIVKGMVYNALYKEVEIYTVLFLQIGVVAVLMYGLLH